MLYMDTSFIMCCAEWGLDPYDALRSVTISSPHYPEGVEVELRQLKKDNSKRSRMAALALTLLKNMKKVQGKGNVDEWLLEHATPLDEVATMDVELRKLLRAKGIRVLTIRQKKYVKIHEGKN